MFCLITNTEWINDDDTSTEAHYEGLLGLHKEINGYLYSGGYDERLNKINPDTGEVIWRYENKEWGVTDIAIDGDKNIYISNRNALVIKLNEESGYVDSDGILKDSELWRFTGHTDEVNVVELDNNKNIYTASVDSTVKKIDEDSGYVDSDGFLQDAVDWTFTGHSSSVNGLSVGSDYLYTGSSDGTARKINFSGTEQWSYDNISAVGSICVDFYSNVYILGNDNTVKKLDSSGNKIWSFTGHGDAVVDICLGKYGNIYSASYDGTLRKLDNAGNELWVFSGHTSTLDADGDEWVTVVSVGSDGNVYSGSGHGDDTIIKQSQRANPGNMKNNVSHTNLTKEGIDKVKSFELFPINKESLLAYYPVQQSLGSDQTTLYDESKSGNDGTGKNGASDVSGKNGRAILLDGSSQYVEIPRNISDSDDFTIIMWVLTDVLDSSKHILLTDGGLVEVCINASNNFQLGIYDGGSWQTVSTDLSLSTSSWYKLMVTYSNSDSTAKLYVDGGLRGEMSISSSTNGSPTTMRIGSNMSGGEYWDGKIDIFMKYDRVINREENQNIYNKTA